MQQRNRFKHWAWGVAKWLVGISAPSGSRWGIFAFLLAASFFLFEGSGMLGQLLPSYPFWQQVAFWAGVVSLVLAFVLGLLWLARGSKDTTAEELRNINQELNEIKGILQDGLPPKEDTYAPRT